MGNETAPTPTEAPEAPAEDTSLRGELEKAFSEAEAPSEAPAPEAGEATSTEAPKEGEESSTTPREDGRDAQGRFKAKVSTQDGTGQPARASTGATTPPKAGEASATTPPAPGPTTEALKAPQSWKPAAREKWAALPPEAQAEVQRREREMASTLQETAEARRVHQAFQQTVSPYEGMIRAEGGEPLQAVASLLRTAAALRTAPVQHRAGMLADMAYTFGVPVEALDAALVARAQGRPMPQGQQQQPMRDERFDAFLNHLRQQEAQRTGALQQQHLSELQEFAASHEFYSDLKDEMADLLEVAARRGVAMDYEEAYSRAVALNPSTRAVVEQRKAAEAANAAQASTQRARAAASSVKNEPGGLRNGHLQNGNSLRDDLSRAYDEAAGR